MMFSKTITFLAISVVSTMTTTTAANFDKLQAFVDNSHNQNNDSQPKHENNERALQDTTGQPADCDYFVRFLDLTVGKMLEVYGVQEMTSWVCNDITGSTRFQGAIEQPYDYFSQNFGKFAGCVGEHFLHGMQEAESLGTPIWTGEKINKKNCAQLIRDWSTNTVTNVGDGSTATPPATTGTTGTTGSGSNGFGFGNGLRRKLAPCKGACVVAKVVTGVVVAGAVGGAEAAVEECGINNNC